MKLTVSLVAVVAFLTLTGDKVEGKWKKAKSDKGKKDKILNGKTVETKVLPMILGCDPSYLSILLGSITIDGIAIDKGLQKKAEKECLDSFAVTPRPEDRERKCTILLDSAKGLVGNETFRAVYQCNMGVVENWDKEHKISNAKAKSGKSAKLKCKGDEIVEVVGLTIGGAEVELSKFPELYSQALDWECTRQRAKTLAVSSTKGNVNCLIYNQPAFGGDLEIQYKCRTSSTH